jgi:Uma2 family endonuclease
MTVSAPVKPALQTAEDLERLSAQDCRYELIRGELHERAFAGGLQGSITSRLSFYVGAVVISENLGITLAAGTGFLVGRDPDTVLAPDFAFVAKDRLPNPLPRSYVPVVPDIVLETRSPNDTRKEIADKVAQWLELGVKSVWKINPRMRLLTVYRTNQVPLSLGEGDTLDGGGVLPDLSVPVARLFL